jgi:Ca2+-transporting ATPase
LFFFIILAGLWQLLWHINIGEGVLSSLINTDTLNTYITGFTDMSRIKTHQSDYEMGIFFTVFVMLQFWNLFNAKYFRTGRSLIQDIIGIFTNPQKVKESYSAGFLWIVLVILVGQILIVTYAGSMFNVSPLSFSDWAWILVITSPVLIVSDIVRFVWNVCKKKN